MLWPLRKAAVLFCPSASEREFQAKLHLSPGRCAEDLTGCGRNVNRRGRKTEVCVIQRIEQLPAELERGPLPDREVLEQRKIQIFETRAEQYIATGIAVHERRS